MKTNPFSKYMTEYCNFDNITEKYTNKRDLNALILLDKLFPDTSNIIRSVESHIICLNISLEDLINKASEEQLLNIIRCGIWYDSAKERLFMYI